MVKAADEHKKKEKLEAAVKRVEVALDALARLRPTLEQQEDLSTFLALKMSTTLGTLKSAATGSKGFTFGRRKPPE